MYVLFAVSGVHFLIGFLSGYYQNITDFASNFFSDPSAIYLTARATTALIGTGCVLLTVLAGRRWFNTGSGILAGLFLAVSVVHSTHSRIAITDVPQSFLVTAVLLPLHGILTRNMRRDYLFCGLLIGFGAATKYLAIFLAPALILAHCLRSRATGSTWQRLIFTPNLWAGMGAIVLGCFIGTPYTFLDIGAFLADFRQQATLSSGSGGGTSFGQLLLHYLPGTFGWPIYLLALVGIGRTVAHQRRVAPVLLSFPLIYLIFVGRYELAFARYTIPLEPFLALAAGSAAYQGYQIAQKRLTAAISIPLAMIIYAVLIAQPLYITMRWNILMAHEPDPRTLALQWANHYIPENSAVAIQPLFDRTFYNAPLMTDLRIEAIMTNIPQGGRFDLVRTTVRRSLAENPLFREIPFVYDLQALEDAGVAYIFISDQNWPAVVSGKSRADQPETRFFHDLQRRATMVQHFTPLTDFSKGFPLQSAALVPMLPPSITIYRVQRVGE
ncbi:MAG: phospholipid carrier-dependent glycosyltransferase [Blastochloris sp.]|nr:phospholipid carrier-dependent glycosyltransferase [Blastochloris sp.]